MAYHYVRDFAESGKLTVLYVISHINLVDLYKSHYQVLISLFLEILY